MKKGARTLTGLVLVAAVLTVLTLPTQALPSLNGSPNNQPAPQLTPIPGLAWQEEALAAKNAAGAAPALSATPRYHTYPEFSNIMTTTVTTLTADVAEGLVFLANIGFTGWADTAMQILDNSGEPVYIQRTPTDLMLTDFKRQTVGGVPYLTYYQGTAAFNWAFGAYYVMDESYTVVDTWTIHDGRGADEHGLELLDNGHAILFSYIPYAFDLSPYGGPSNGYVVDIYIEEQDADKNVVFSWRASEHIPFTDSYVGFSVSPVDYVHTNAVEMDTDGNFLISSRHLSEITKINRQTGAIMWRLGGKSNQFTFTNDIGFSFQHDIRRLDNGNITLLDNGNQHEPPFSRAIEYQIDETAKTATRVWQYPNDQSVFAPFMANAQRLSNGNTFIGWGGHTVATEATPDSEKAFEMLLGDMVYRAFRFTWDATPAELPRAVIAPTVSPTTATIYSAWNGATDITGYQIYAGPTPGNVSLVETVSRTGFETTTDLSGLDENTCVFKIRPVHEQGRETPFSPVVFRRDRPECLAQLGISIYFPLQMQ